jgi:hypothetical protein
LGQLSNFKYLKFPLNKPHKFSGPQNRNASPGGVGIWRGPTSTIPSPALGSSERHNWAQEMEISIDGMKMVVFILVLS